MRALVPVVCLSALIAGCGGGAKTVTETQTQPPSGSETTGSTTGPTTGTSATTIAQTTIPHPTGDHGPVYFETPSHNIGCYVDATSGRCDIRQRGWAPPPEPRYCLKAGVDWGQGLVVGHRRAEFVCAGDTALGGKAVLGYGQSSEHGQFICLSQPSGITCANTQNRHGFFLSRETYRIF